MTFTPATGTNSDVANSYVDLAYADAYFALRGNSTWIGSDAVKQAALVRATDFIDQTYKGRFIGMPVCSGLAWPRYTTGFYQDVIPNDLKKATCELALEALQGDLNPVTGGEQAVIREKVDVIDIEYSETVTARRRPAVTGYLSGLLGGSAFNRPVVRV